MDLPLPKARGRTERTTRCRKLRDLHTARRGRPESSTPKASPYQGSLGRTTKTFTNTGAERLAARGTPLPGFPVPTHPLDAGAARGSHKATRARTGTEPAQTPL